MRNLVLKVKCVTCGKVHTIRVNESDYVHYYKGEPVQFAFPYLSANERELLISNICGKCYDEMFKEDE